jgi:hypothetical protein
MRLHKCAYTRGVIFSMGIFWTGNVNKVASSAPKTVSSHLPTADSQYRVERVGEALLENRTQWPTDLSTVFCDIMSGKGKGGKGKSGGKAGGSHSHSARAGLQVSVLSDKTTGCERVPTFWGCYCDAHFIESVLVGLLCFYSVYEGCIHGW